MAVVSRPAATTTPTLTVTMAAISAIGAAVSTASQRNDMIQVAHGTYKEEVLMGKPQSLIGQHTENGIIDATGRSNGIDIYGIDNAGLANVVVTKFSW
jgi:pectin methylesterase-like acyl-CoA thioesterase